MPTDLSKNYHVHSIHLILLSHCKSNAMPGCDSPKLYLCETQGWETSQPSCVYSSHFCPALSFFWSLCLCMFLFLSLTPPPPPLYLSAKKNKKNQTKTKQNKMQKGYQFHTVHQILLASPALRVDKQPFHSLIMLTNISKLGNTSATHSRYCFVEPPSLS